MQWVWGPYGWNSDGIWELPPGCISSIDMRRLSDMGPQSLGQRNFAVFAARDDATFGTDHRLLGSGNPYEVALALRMRERFRDDLALPSTPNAETLAQLLAELLLKFCDPDGADMARPLVPNVARQWRIQVAGWVHEMSFSREHIGYQRLRDLLRRNYRKIRQAVIDGALPDDHHRKYLGAQALKYFGRHDHEDYRELLGDQPDEGTRRPTTTVSDDFNDGDLIGWTAVGGGSWSNPGTIATYSADGSGEQALRYDTDLSFDDMYSECDLKGDDGDGGGPIARKDSSTTLTYYWVDVRTGNTTHSHNLYKVESGSLTELDGSLSNLNLQVDDTIRLTTDGSDIDVTHNGSPLFSATDTAIIGNLRAGIASFGGADWSANNFQAEDIPPETNVTPSVAAATLASVAPASAISRALAAQSAAFAAVTPDHTLAVEATAVGAVSRARQLTAASSQYFTRASEATFAPGASDFWVAAWVYHDSLASLRTIIAHGAGSNTNPGFWLYTTSGGSIQCQLAVGDGTARVTGATVGGIVTTGVWQYVFVSFDRNGDMVIFLDTSEVEREGISSQSAAVTPSNPFRVGAFSASVAHLMDGRAARVAMGAVSDIGDAASGTLAETIRERLYNDHLGLIYGEISSAERTAWGLTAGSGAYYDGDERIAGADLLDAVNDLDLTATNSPGLASGPDTDAPKLFTSVPPGTALAPTPPPVSGAFAGGEPITAQVIDTVEAALQSQSPELSVDHEIPSVAAMTEATTVEPSQEIIFIPNPLILDAQATQARAPREATIPATVQPLVTVEPSRSFGQDIDAAEGTFTATDVQYGFTGFPAADGITLSVPEHAISIDATPDPVGITLATVEPGRELDQSLDGVGAAFTAGDVTHTVPTDLPEVSASFTSVEPDTALAGLLDAPVVATSVISTTESLTVTLDSAALTLTPGDLVGNLTTALDSVELAIAAQDTQPTHVAEAPSVELATAAVSPFATAFLVAAAATVSLTAVTPGVALGDTPQAATAAFTAVTPTPETPTTPQVVQVASAAQQVDHTLAEGPDVAGVSFAGISPTHDLLSSITPADLTLAPVDTAGGRLVVPAPATATMSLTVSATSIAATPLPKSLMVVPIPPPVEGEGVPTFSVVDNADDTGITLTVNQATGSWTFYAADWDGAFAGNWTAEAMGSGNGVITVGLTAGYHLAYVDFSADMVVSKPKYFLVTTGDEAVFEQCLDGVLDALKSLDLPGVTNANIIRQKVPWHRGNAIDQDKIIVSPYPERRDHQAGSNQQEETQYGVLVTILTAGNRDLTTGIGVHLRRRQMLTRHFVNQPLPAIEEVERVEVEPDDPYPENAFGRNVDAQGIVIRCIAREPRT